jgi:biopolymer transport protein ExbD
MARKKKAFDEKMEDLNLVPIMNLVVVLIPVVLFGMSLVKIGVVNVNAPKFGMGQAAPADDDKKPLNLTIGIEEAGFRLKAGGADINQVLGLAAEAPATPEAMAAAAGGLLIPKNKDSYDYVDLYGKLVTIKEAFPEESIVNLSADSKIHFKYIIAVMDSIRYRLEQNSYPDAAAFADGMIKVDGNQMSLLWPDVVFAVAQ